MKRNLIAALVAASTVLVVTPSFGQTGGSGAGGSGASGSGQTYTQDRDSGGRHWGWLGLLGLIGLSGLRRKSNDDSARVSGRAV
ncbi:MAG TPA: WGxxGxxG family protein [Usitatibacter sp.]|nr:WGxxGxxG family protein [Usitatibacter sp.]